MSSTQRRGDRGAVFGAVTNGIRNDGSRREADDPGRSPVPRLGRVKERRNTPALHRTRTSLDILKPVPITRQAVENAFSDPHRFHGPLQIQFTGIPVDEIVT